MPRAYRKPSVTNLSPEITDDGCWVGSGSLDRRTGYRRIHHMAHGKGKAAMAHRVFYEVAKGKIPPGLCIDHLCRNRECVNPAHLEPVTRGENTMRGETITAANILKTKCPRGHAYDGRDKKGRTCSECRRAKDRRRYARQHKRRLAEKRGRADTANRFLEIIASHGRRFFRHGENVARFDIDDRSRVWLTDPYTGKRIYTHQRGRWRGFTGGGTMKALCEALRDFINDHAPLPLNHLGPWPDYVCGGDLWGYGDSMAAVRSECAALTDF